MVEVTFLTGDSVEQLTKLADNSIHMCVTSPPYYKIRDYGIDGQIGQEVYTNAICRTTGQSLS